MEFWSIVVFVEFSALFSKIEGIFIESGQGFIMDLNLDNETNQLNVKICTFQFNDGDSHTVDLSSEPEVPIATVRGEIVTRYMKNICGIRVANVTILSTGEWRLMATFSGNSNTTASNKLKISVYEGKPDKFTTIKTITKFGGYPIDCTFASGSRSCRIYNKANGQNHLDTCVISETIRNNSEFVCYILRHGRVDEIEEVIDFRYKDITDLIPHARTTETEKYLTLTCDFPDPIKMCVASLPRNGGQLLIDDGLLSENYSVQNTSINNGHCVLEVKKPLVANQKGILNIYDETDLTPSGCIFYIGNKPELINQELARLQTVDTIEIVKTFYGNRLTIMCEVPYPIDTCYLKSPYPEHSVHFPNAMNFARTRSVGRCVFETLMEISGTWTCGMSGAERREEVIKQFNVVVHDPEIPGIVLPRVVKSSTGDVVTILCQAQSENPIVNCAFSDPAGYVHVLSDRALTREDSRYEYFGKGFAYGNCGIRIKSLTTAEFGDWKCYFNGYYQSNATQLIATIAGNSISEATSIGLGVGLTCLVLIAFGGGGYFYYRKRQNRSTQQPQEAPMVS